MHITICALQYAQYIDAKKRGEFVQPIRTFLQSAAGTGKSFFYENYYIKGIINKRLGKLEVSKKNYFKSIELNPNHYLSYNEIGYVFYLNKDFENAYFYINKSITINKSFKEGFLNRGMINLLAGKFIEGWEDYCLGKDTKYPITKKSLWDGQLNLKNKSIFIFSEQGLGDVIQFTRYLFILSNHFDKIIYKIPNSLKHLFSNINSAVVNLK